MLRKLMSLALAGLLMAVSVHATEQATEHRLDEVAKRGAQVMPFDLDQTTHVFTKTVRGGVQQVVANDKSSQEQIKLIRQHLATIAGEFAQGDYSRPAKIHGDDMPGLASLRSAKPGQIKISYTDLADGGKVDFATDNPKLIKALHQWFDAQLHDHARHAISGKGPHAMQHMDHMHHSHDGMQHQ